ARLPRGDAWPEDPAERDRRDRGSSGRADALGRSATAMTRAGTPRRVRVLVAEPVDAQHGGHGEDERERDADRSGQGASNRNAILLARTNVPPGTDRRKIPDPREPGLRRIRDGLPRQGPLDRQEGRDQGPPPPERRLRRPAPGAAAPGRARPPEH